MHLIIDGWLSAVLTRAKIQEFLSDLPGLIGMSIIHPPIVRQHRGNWMGIVIIAESHISLHQDGDWVHIDIFSCKPFDQAWALAETQHRLSLKQSQPQLLYRPMPEVADER